MQIITVHVIRNGQDAIAGEISWDGVELVANPPTDPTLLNMVQEVQSSDYPLDQLHNKYRGVYLHTSPPINCDIQPTQFSQNAQATHYTDPDTINTLMEQLNHPDNNAHRWGLDEPLHGVRGILADALDENGHEKEAELLRTPGQHVITHNDQIVPGRFTDQHTHHATGNLMQHVNDINYDDYAWPELEILHPGEEGRYRAIDFDDPESYRQPIPNGHARLVHHDMTGSELHLHQDVPFNELGGRIASILEDHMSLYDPLEASPTPEADEELIGHHLHNIRNAPYEEPIT
jgi:hypothetical protein